MGRMEADLIFFHGPILAGEGFEEVEALATVEDRIAAVGTEREVFRLQGPETRVIDLEGRALLPAFIDSHTHLVDAGVLLLRLDLSGAQSRLEVLDRVQRRCAITPSGGWVVGHSWDESEWVGDRHFPDRKELDTIDPSRPILLVRVDQHVGVASTAALMKSGLDPAKHPSGVVREEELGRVLSASRPSSSTKLQGLRLIVHTLHTHGIASVSTFVDGEDLPLLAESHETLDLLRVCAYVKSESPPPPSLEKVRILGSKLFADGSVGAKTASLSLPYRSGERVPPLLSGRKLSSLFSKLHQEGAQIAVHAIGDVAIEEVLRAFESLPADEVRRRRHRIEHVEFAHDDQIQRMGELGIVASMQPNFVSRWGHPGGMYSERLGEEVVGAHNRFRRFLEEGVPLAFGSDHMPLGPLEGIRSALLGPTPSQRLTLKEALRAYTWGGAFAQGAEDHRGILEKGLGADLVILSEDPRRVDPDRLPSLGIEGLYVGGRRAWGKI